MSNTTIVDIELWRLISAYLFILILLLFVKLVGLKKETKIIIATLRMTIQLVLVGYLLTYILKNPHPVVTIAIVIVILLFALNNVFKQIDQPVSIEMKRVIIASLFIGSLTSLLYFNFVVIHFKPWYDPRYFIPFSGMIIGNSMTGITLGVKGLIDGMKTRKEVVEAALMLGATPKVATMPLVKQAFESAILPTLNSMLGMGIIFLPGMMTGQILSGISPITAIEYQIAILLGIAGSVSITVIIFLQYGYKTFFNESHQLKDE